MSQILILSLLGATIFHLSILVDEYYRSGGFFSIQLKLVVKKLKKTFFIFIIIFLVILIKA